MTVRRQLGEPMRGQVPLRIFCGPKLVSHGLGVPLLEVFGGIKPLEMPGLKKRKRFD